jgi:hypothetical protein
MELHPWRFDSIRSHSYDDVNRFSFQFLIFSKNFGYRAPPWHVQKKSQWARPPLPGYVKEALFWLVPARSGTIWKYITLDGQTLWVTRPLTRGMQKSTLFFAPILAVCRARAITNPIRQWSSSCYSAYHWLIGLVISRARHTAKMGAKSLTEQKKTFSFIAHLCSEMAVLGRKSTFRQAWSIRYSSSDMLFNPT